MRCDLSRLLARKITKRIHSSKPASLNRPIAVVVIAVVVIAVVVIAVVVIAVVAVVVVSLLPLLSCRGGGWEWG